MSAVTDVVNRYGSKFSRTAGAPPADSIQGRAQRVAAAIKHGADTAQERAGEAASAATESAHGVADQVNGAAQQTALTVRTSSKSARIAAGVAIVGLAGVLAALVRKLRDAA
jgi:hypothetical protein